MLLKIVIGPLLYVVVFMTVLTSRYGLLMDGFEAPRGTPLIETILDGALTILGIPLLTVIPHQWFPGLSSYLLLLLNGCIWTTVIIGLTRLVRRHLPVQVRSRAQ